MEIYPIVSWSLVLFLGGVAVYVYKPELLKKAFPADASPTQLTTASSKQSSKKQKTKKPKAVQDVLDDLTTKVVSSSDETRAKKKRKITAPVGPSIIATTVQGEQKELPRDTGNDIDDKSFAQQLAKAQAGTKLQSDSQQKKVALKNTGATLQPKKSEDVLSTVELSSTTGQDADDDLSSVESVQQKPSSGKDISDMLERPAAAPATLRLTNVSEEPKKPKAAPKQFEQVQSKKKRNEQARREEQKRLREESDRIHEQKKQEQLRRARMAEGTSNQTKANTFASNAWQTKNEKFTTNTGAAPLLDTFEPSNSNAVAPSGVQTASMSKSVPANNVDSLKSEIGSGATSALAASGREQGAGSDWAGRMSEEEQLQRLRDQEQDDAWESVTSKKTKKKARAENDTSSEASFSASQPAPVPVAKPAAKVQAPRTNGAIQPKETANRFETIKPVSMEGVQDDEWAA